MKTVCRFTDKATGLKFELVEPKTHNGFDNCTGCVLDGSERGAVMSPAIKARVCRDIIGYSCLKRGRVVKFSKQLDA